MEPRLYKYFKTDCRVYYESLVRKKQPGQHWRRENTHMWSSSIAQSDWLREFCIFAASNIIIIIIIGVYVIAARYYRCSHSNAKRSFYRAFNAIFGKIGWCASEEVIIELLKMKCILVLLYGLYRILSVQQNSDQITWLCNKQCL